MFLREFTPLSLSARCLLPLPSIKRTYSPAMAEEIVMKFREIALIALWTTLIGPVLAQPVIDRSEPKERIVAVAHKPPAPSLVRR